MTTLKAKYIIGKRKQNGSALLTVIVAMVIIGVLGVAIYTLTYTSLSNQAVAQRAPRAFYLSESGVRIAASEYRAAVTTDSADITNNTFTAHSVLPALHNKTFKLADNVSSFTVYAYPYWFYANDPYPANSGSMILYLPGGIPQDDTGAPITIPNSGLLRVRNSAAVRPALTAWNGTKYVYYTGAVPDPSYSSARGTQVTFTLSTLFGSDILKGDEFYIGFVTPQNSNQTGTNLTIYIPTTYEGFTYDHVNMAKWFPPRQGTIIVEKTKRAYKYDLRIIDSSSTPIAVTLTNIQTLDGEADLVTIQESDKIYVGKSIGFRSTSTYGEQ